MWCKNCRQDAPAIASGEGVYCCVRCGERISSRSTDDQPPATETKTSHETDDEHDLLSAFDFWESEERLRHVGRMLRDPLEDDLHERDFHDGDHEWVSIHSAHGGRRRRGDDRFRDAPGQNGGVQGFVAWTCLALGLSVFACGAALAAWSVAGERPELWDLGLPIAMIGQAGMLLGFVLGLGRRTGHRESQSRRDFAPDDRRIYRRRRGARR